MWQCFGTLPSICHVAATDIAVLRYDAALPALLTVLFTEGVHGSTSTCALAAAAAA